MYLKKLAVLLEFNLIFFPSLLPPPTQVTVLPFRLLVPHPPHSRKNMFSLAQK